MKFVSPILIWVLVHEDFPLTLNIIFSSSCLVSDFLANHQNFWRGWLMRLQTPVEVVLSPLLPPPEIRDKDAWANRMCHLTLAGTNKSFTKPSSSTFNGFLLLNCDYGTTVLPFSSFWPFSMISQSTVIKVDKMGKTCFLFNCWLMNLSTRRSMVHIKKYGILVMHFIITTRNKAQKPADVCCYKAKGIPWRTGQFIGVRKTTGLYGRVEVVLALGKMGQGWREVSQRMHKNAALKVPFGMLGLGAHRKSLFYRSQLNRKFLTFFSPFRLLLVAQRAQQIYKSLGRSLQERERSEGRCRSGKNRWNLLGSTAPCQPCCLWWCEDLFCFHPWRWQH